MNRTAEAPWISCAACALVATGGAAAWADGPGAPAEPGPPDRPGEVIVVEGSAPAAARDRERALGEAPFVTILHPDEHPATASVADAIATSAGAQTRSL